jgi:hypothetical protein
MGKGADDHAERLSLYRAGGVDDGGGTMKPLGPLYDNPSPEVMAEMEAQHTQLEEPMKAFRQTTHDWMAASTKAFIALRNCRYRAGEDQGYLRICLEFVKTQAEYLARLLDDHVEERLQPEGTYVVAIMSVNSAQMFKDDLGGMFDIWTDPDGSGNATDPVRVYYGLPGSHHRDEDDGEEDGGEEDGDEEGAEEEAEEVVHYRIADECIAHPPKPAIPIAAKSAIKKNILTTTPNEEGFFDFNDFPAEPAPVQSRPAGPRKEERFKSKKETT